MGLYTIPIESQMEVFARVYAQSAGITIVPGTGFSTDGKVIFMVFLPDSAPAYERFKSEMFAYHETGHCKFSDMKLLVARFAIKDASGKVTGIKDKFLRGLHNSIEDVWIEHAMETKWVGMARKWAMLFPKLVKDKCVKTNNPNLPPAEWMCQLLYLKGREAQLGVQFGYTVPAPIQELFDKRVAKFVPEVANCTSTKEALDIAERVAKEIQDLINEQEKNEQEKRKQQGKGQKSEQSDGQESSESGGDSGDEPQDGDQGSGDQSSEPSDTGDEEDPQSGSGSEGGSKKQTSKAMSSDVEAGNSTGSETDPGDDGDDGAPEQDQAQPENSEGDDADQDAISDELKKLLKDLKKQINNGDMEDTDISKQVADSLNKYVDTHHILRDANGLKEDFEKVVPESGSGWEYEVQRHEQKGREMTGYCGNKLRNLFISERAPRWQGNLETGKLDTRRLTRLKTSGSKAIFRRKTEHVYEDSAVSLVIDHSGSMGGEKAEMALALLTAMATEFDRLRIPFETFGFTSASDRGPDPYVRVQPCQIRVIKTFEQSYRQVVKNFTWPRGAGGTNEWPAIRLAAQRLAMRKETKKVLFILTDGGTAYACAQKQAATRNAMKEFIGRCMRAGMKVVGFGIKDDDAKFYCPDFIEVNDLAKFASEFYGKLMQYLL